MKISIIGVGKVGSALSYTLLLRGLASELVLVDRERKAAEGEAMDLEHAGSFINHPVLVRAGSLKDTEGSDVVVLACSVPWNTAYVSRFDLGRDNLAVFNEIVPVLAKASPSSKMLVISNPVDVMTYHTIRLSGFSADRVFGTGTLVDSARFRSLLSEKMGIHPDDLRAYSLGEHGDSQFPVFSLAVAGGTRITENAATHEIFRHASRSGLEVVNRKGHTSYTISMAASLVIEAISWDTRRTMPLSVLINGFLGIHDVCLSLPVVVGSAGIVRVLEPELGNEEAASFRRCAEIVKEGIKRSLGT